VPLRRWSRVWPVSAAEVAERLTGRPVVAVRRLSGGDLSAVFRLTFADGGTLIAKQAATAMVEADMLRAIRAADAPAPDVVAAEGEWLLMEDVAANAPVSAAWPDLARALARLHVASGADYGWPVDHAFGAVMIENHPSPDWPTFGRSGGCFAICRSSVRRWDVESSGLPTGCTITCRGVRRPRCCMAICGAGMCWSWATVSPR